MKSSVKRLRSADPARTPEVADHLARAYPAADSVARNTAAHRSNRLRPFAAVSVGAALVLGGCAVGAGTVSTSTGEAVIALLTGGSRPQPDARELPQAEPLLNLQSPELTAELTQIATTLPLPPGQSREALVNEFKSGFNATDAPLTKVEIGALMEKLVVGKWYQYWLSATPRERRAAQPTLDSFQDLPNMWRQDWSHYDVPGSRMVLLARIAEAAKHGDGKPMRFWLWEQGIPGASRPPWISEKGG